MDASFPIKAGVPLPMVHYTLGWLEQQRGNTQSRAETFPPRRRARARLLLPGADRGHRHSRIRHGAPIRGMPARRTIWATCSTTAAATRRRFGSGKQSAKLDPDFSIVWRNLGIGYFNIRRQPAKARAAYDRAFQADSGRRPAALRTRPTVETARRKAREALARTGAAPGPCPAAG